MNNEQDKVISLNAVNLKIFLEIASFFSTASVFFKRVENMIESLPASAPYEKQNSILFDEFFTEEISNMSASIMNRFNGIEYIDSYMPMALSAADFKLANKIIQKISCIIPTLKPLDMKLNSNELLAYTAILKTNTEAKKHIEQYLNCFSDAFEEIHQSAPANEPANEHSLSKEHSSSDRKRSLNMISSSYFKAAETNNVQKLVKCLEETSRKNEKLHIDTEHWKGGTALSIAILHDSRDVVAKLLNLNADALNRYHVKSAISQAIKCNRNECLDFIIKSGIIDMQSNEWMAGLHNLKSVIFSGHSQESLEVFLKNGLNPDMLLYASPLIFEAMKAKDYDALYMLAKYGANLSKVDNTSATLFSDALQRQDEEDLDVLAQNGFCYLNDNLASLHTYCTSKNVALYDALQRFEIKTEHINFGKNIFHKKIEHTDIETCRSLLEAK